MIYNEGHRKHLLKWKDKTVFSIFGVFEWMATLNLRLKLFLIVPDKNGPETASFPNSQDCCKDKREKEYVWNYIQKYKMLYNQILLYDS